MLASEVVSSNRDILNPLKSTGKQLLSDIVTRHQEFNVLQTTEQAGDVLDLLDSQFYEVLHTCEESHLGLLKTYLEGKLVLELQDRQDLNAINARNILSYFDKLSTVTDRRKCLEICACLINGESSVPWLKESETDDVIKRPMTTESRPTTSRVKTPLGSTLSQATNRSQFSLRREKSAILDAYETTYDRQFHRPLTATCITRPLSAYPSAADELGDLRKHYTSSYSTQFYEKEPSKMEPIRSGSGSGNRRNNPHPLRPFMMYQLPRSQPFGLMIPQTPDFGDRKIQSAIRAKTSSSYFHNYLGLPPGVNIKSAFNAEREPKSEQNMRLQRSNSCFETTTGRVFRNPESPQHLRQENYTRHGCNKNLEKVAGSIVPTASQRLLLHPIRGRATTYESEFVPRPIPKHIPTRRPKPKEEIYGGIDKVPTELAEKKFVVNKSEILNWAKENNEESKKETEITKENGEEQLVNDEQL